MMDFQIRNDILALRVQIAALATLGGQSGTTFDPTGLEGQIALVAQDLQLTVGNLSGQMSALEGRISSLEEAGPEEVHSERQRLPGINKAGTTLYFTEVFASAYSYMPVVIGRSGDGQREVEVGWTPHADSIDLEPAEDDTVIYVTAQELGTTAEPHCERYRVTDVAKTGYNKPFAAPFPSEDSYIPTVIGKSGDGLREVEVGFAPHASSIDIFPAEDDTTVYLRVEEI
jgi:hypothetical protein